MNIQQQRQRLDAQARADGLDVDRLRKEFNEMGNIFHQAARRVRRRKSFLGRLFWNPYGSPFKGLGYIDPELDAEVEEIEHGK